jgi:acyl-CoA reductase-like NAD-dependent aldehyde dehydrogenase
VVRKDADLKDAARKVAFFKLCNAGQICININQVAVAEEVAEPFLAELKAAYAKQIGEVAEQNGDYPKLITLLAYDKCASLAEEYRDRIVFGGMGTATAAAMPLQYCIPSGLKIPLCKRSSSVRCCLWCRSRTARLTV